jgi:hypothetical protein
MAMAWGKKQSQKTQSVALAVKRSCTNRAQVALILKTHTGVRRYQYRQLWRLLVVALRVGDRGA